MNKTLENILNENLEKEMFEIAKFGYLKANVRKRGGLTGNAPVCYDCEGDCSVCKDKMNSDKRLEEKAINNLITRHIFNNISPCPKCDSKDIGLYSPKSYLRCNDCGTETPHFEETLVENYEKLINTWNLGIFIKETIVLNAKDMSEEIQNILYVCSSDIQEPNSKFKSRRLCRVNLKYSHVWGSYPHEKYKEDILKLTNYFKSLEINDNEDFLIRTY